MHVRAYNCSHTQYAALVCAGRSSRMDVPYLLRAIPDAVRYFVHMRVLAYPQKATQLLLFFLRRMGKSSQIIPSWDGPLLAPLLRPTPGHQDNGLYLLGTKLPDYFIDPKTRWRIRHIRR